MKQKNSDEFKKFNDVMGGLLSVPYKELQEKLKEEKQTKIKKGRAKSMPAARASVARKS